MQVLFQVQGAPGSHQADLSVEAATHPHCPLQEVLLLWPPQQGQDKHVGALPPEVCESGCGLV